jgi:hypothetical protein
LALPALRRLAPEARAEFLAQVEAAIRADRRVSLHEFVILSLLRAQLASPARPKEARATLAARRDDVVAVLSLVSHAGGGEVRAFHAGAKEIGFGDAVQRPRAALSLEAAQASLAALRGLAPGAKERLVRALFAAAAADGVIRLGESELLRLVGAVLDCPLPPLVDPLEPAGRPA